MSPMVKITQAPMRSWLRCLAALAGALGNNLEQPR